MTRKKILNTASFWFSPGMAAVFYEPRLVFEWEVNRWRIATKPKANGRIKLHASYEKYMKRIHIN